MENYVLEPKPVSVSITLDDFVQMLEEQITPIWNWSSVFFRLKGDGFLTRKNACPYPTLKAQRLGLLDIKDEFQDSQKVMVTEKGQKYFMDYFISKSSPIL